MTPTERYRRNSNAALLAMVAIWGFMLFLLLLIDEPWYRPLMAILFLVHLERLTE
jgi:hypothetical protein